MVSRWLEVRESKSQAARSPRTRQGRDRRGKRTWKRVEQQGRQQLEQVNINIPWATQYTDPTTISRGCRLHSSLRSPPSQCTGKPPADQRYSASQ